MMIGVVFLLCQRVNNSNLAGIHFTEFSAVSIKSTVILMKLFRFGENVSDLSVVEWTVS